MKLEFRNPSAPEDYRHYTTDDLRRHYVIPQVFAPDEALLTYSHFDRIIAGGIMPVEGQVALEGCKELACDYFLQRREMGVLNIGGDGVVTVDGTVYELGERDCLYIGMGAKELLFASKDKNKPAKFYLNSATAHKNYPNRLITLAQAKANRVGSLEGCNHRVIYQYLHPTILDTCQLCMGITALEPGSNWNTMPPHLHDRRMEVYLYFGLDPETVIFHMMGTPQETRHLLIHNEQGVISPSWSIHSGVGTRNFAYIWGMVGENRDFDDMDVISPADLL